MGLYIEPPTGTKWDWVTQNGSRVQPATFLDAKTEPHGIVAFMDNGPFQAIAFIFSKKEALRCSLGRPDALWYRVPSEVIRKNIGEHVWREI